MRKTVLFSTLAAICILFASCKTVQTTLVPKADMEHLSNYKCVNYMGWNGTTYETNTPGSIPQTAIQDECKLLKIEGNKVTCELLLRSHTNIDQDFTRYMVKLNGKTIAPIIQGQSMEVRDYTYTGSYTVAAVHTSNSDGRSFDMDISKPADMIFRVIERKVIISGVVDNMTDELSIDLGLRVEWNTVPLGEIFRFKMM